MTLHVAAADCKVMPPQENQDEAADPYAYYDFRLVRGQSKEGCV
jgi:hypothetical protein